MKRSSRILQAFKSFSHKCCQTGRNMTVSVNKESCVHSLHITYWELYANKARTFHGPASCSWVFHAGPSSPPAVPLGWPTYASSFLLGRDSWLPVLALEIQDVFPPCTVDKPCCKQQTCHGSLCSPHPVQHALRWRMLGGNTFCSLNAVY